MAWGDLRLFAEEGLADMSLGCACGREREGACYCNGAEQVS